MTQPEWRMSGSRRQSFRHSSFGFGHFMKALLLTEYRRLQVVDLPRPEITPNEVLVRVAACGICGSDVHGYDGSTGRRIPPLVMGHEAAGIVQAVGSDVETIK